MKSELIARYMEAEEVDGYFVLPQHEEIRYIPYSYETEQVIAFKAEELKYNESWNWLMPVISKIQKSDWYDAYTMDTNNEALAIAFDIDKTFEGAVKAIEWHLT